MVAEPLLTIDPPVLLLFGEKMEAAPAQLLVGITGPVTYNIYIIDPNFWAAMDKQFPS
jgi:hypothetical protein